MNTETQAEKVGKGDEPENASKDQPVTGPGDGPSIGDVLSMTELLDLQEELRGYAEQCQEHAADASAHASTAKTAASQAKGARTSARQYSEKAWAHWLSVEAALEEAKTTSQESLLEELLDVAQHPRVEGALRRALVALGVKLGVGARVRARIPKRVQR